MNFDHCGFEAEALGRVHQLGLVRIVADRRGRGVAGLVHREVIELGRIALVEEEGPGRQFLHDNVLLVG